MERSTRRLFLALETGNDPLLDAVLSANAIVRLGNNSSREAARPVLARLSDWVRTTSTNSKGAASDGLRSEIVEVRALPDGQRLVSVDVWGVEEVEGNWKLRFGGTSPASLIEEIILPNRK